jgi:hypothetical protein
MLKLKFVESKEEQGHKRFADLERAAECTLRLTEPLHNERPRILIADAWVWWAANLICSNAKRVVQRGQREDPHQILLQERLVGGCSGPIGVLAASTSIMTARTAKLAWLSMASQHTLLELSTWTVGP